MDFLLYKHQFPHTYARKITWTRIKSLSLNAHEQNVYELIVNDIMPKMKVCKLVRRIPHQTLLKSYL